MDSDNTVSAMRPIVLRPTENSSESRMQDNLAYLANQEIQVENAVAELDDGAGDISIVCEDLDVDQRLIRLWLHGHSKHTQRIYRRQAFRFQEYIGRSLSTVTLDDLQSYADYLETMTELGTRSRAHALGSVKSLLSFATRIGILKFNVGAALRLPPVRDGLAGRILPEADVQRILALEVNPRNNALLRILYCGGLRVEEVAGLRIRDLAENGTAGQVTVFGKGGKTRSVLLTERTWAALREIRGDAGDDDPLFRSRRYGGALTACAIWRVVRSAAARAGINLPVSPHWFRHAHASHALDRGAPIHLVQQTLGHSSLATTSRYTHARPGESSGECLAV